MWFKLLFESAQDFPDRIAFVEAWSGRSVTFSSLLKRAEHYAGALRLQGIGPGDTVALMADTSIELVVAILGHYLAGVVHAPINTRYGPEEVQHILGDSGACLILADANHAETVRTATPSLAQIYLGPDFETSLKTATFVHTHDDEDIALLIYTSGTTGKSKGVELSFRSVVSNIKALTDLWQWSHEDILALALPLFHVHGLCIGIHGALIQGCGVELQQRFEPTEIVASIQRGATIFMGVPTMYAMLLEHLKTHPDDAALLSHAKLFTSGSAPLAARHFEEFLNLTGHAILERYGMSETLLTLSNPHDGERRPGTVGKPVPGSEVRIAREDGSTCEPMESGQIVVRGDSLMTGYRGAPAQTAAAFNDGWFLTGDIAEMSQDGYFKILGRASTDIIKSGGFKIAAREIEDVLALHPWVREIAVLGVHDDVWGERIVAAVVAPGHDPAEVLGELQVLGREHLADFKQIRGVVLMPALLRNAMGKIQKHLMKDLDFYDGPALLPPRITES
jgi:acyl-CoA synthetase (AMP-forming)/AMP-acid ligase II